MVKTTSVMLPLGTILPSFELPLVKETMLSIFGESSSFYSVSSNMFIEKPLLIMVICAHCPFVKHIEKELTKIDVDFGHKVNILAVSSNSVETHPEDSIEKLALQLERNSWTFPYLFDSEQSLAKSLKAACTPDFFLFDSDSKKGGQKLVYRGQLDESCPTNNIPVTGKDLRLALDSVLKGNEILFDQKPSIGCNIKWQRGKEPSWFA